VPSPATPKTMATTPTPLSKGFAIELLALVAPAAICRLCTKEQSLQAFILEPAAAEAAC